jgi:hypothetical protein
MNKFRGVIVQLFGVYGLFTQNSCDGPENHFGSIGLGEEMLNSRTDCLGDAFAGGKPARAD